jgi:hypothetical protein
MSETQTQEQSSDQEQQPEQAPQEQQPAEQTKPVELKLKPQAQKMKDYISGLSDRALMTQIKSQEKDGKDAMYMAMLETEMKMRQEKEKAKKG